MYISGINRNDIMCTYRPGSIEIKMLEVLTNPENEGLTQTEKIKLVGCSRNTFYRILRKPEFNYLLNQQFLTVVRENLGKVIKQTLRYGLEEKTNYQDRKMLLQMAQLLSDRSGNNFNVGINAAPSTGSENPFDGLDISELKSLAMKYKNDPDVLIEDIQGVQDIE